MPNKTILTPDRTLLFPDPATREALTRARNLVLDLDIACDDARFELTRASEPWAMQDASDRIDVLTEQFAIARDELARLIDSAGGR